MKFLLLIFWVVALIVTFMTGGIVSTSLSIFAGFALLITFGMIFIVFSNEGDE